MVTGAEMKPNNCVKIIHAKCCGTCMHSNLEWGNDGTCRKHKRSIHITDVCVNDYECVYQDEGVGGYVDGDGYGAYWEESYYERKDNLKTKIIDYYKEHGTAYPSDVALNLDISLKDVVKTTNELVNERILKICKVSKYENR